MTKTDTGLETVQPLYGPKTHVCWTPDHTPINERELVQLMPVGEYVTRSQAEELLAAKDADIAYWVKETQRCLKSAQSLADDNAAQAARIEGLEKHCELLCDPTIIRLEKENSGLEAKLVTAEKLLQGIVAAWESLPGGRNYSTNEVQDWLLGPMQKAINRIRAMLKGESS